MTLVKVVQQAVAARESLADEIEKTITSHRCNGKLLSDLNASRKECD